MIRSVLIANRGEIARRITRTCRRLGIRVAAVYSDADANSLHVTEADSAFHIGPAPAAGSYLNISAILEAARRSGVEAIHPGYGFLAESAEFARACAAAGLLFIGPPPEAIAAMGDKRAARALAARAGLPILPGYGGEDQSDAAFAAAVEKLGYPLLVKAAAGGGGRGMRLVGAAAELPEALESARREATAAFGSGDLLLERALRRPRHVEVQVLGDNHGRLLHLGERDCSIQRRYQKIIEECPSPAVSPELRSEMGAAAVALASAAGYYGAGTVEFLLEDGRYYFLEMNTRLQVEHPVTELVTGIDLVEWQIRVAAGEALPWTQEGIRLDGHAVEARLYAEDPAGGFRPSGGRVLVWRPPEEAGDAIRVDHAIREGDEVGGHYDPMLAKIIARCDTREAAIRHLRRALEATTLLGLRSNLDYLLQIANHPAFSAGEATTRFVDEFAPAPPDAAAVTPALVAAGLARQHADAGDGPGYWRNNPGRPAPYLFAVDGEVVALRVRPLRHTTGRFTVELPATGEMDVTLEEYDGREMTLTAAGERQRFVLARDSDTWWARTAAGIVELRERPLLPEPRRAAGIAGSPRAPIPGRVLAVLVEVGEAVAEGQPLVKLEAMKMEHTLRAAAAGVVAVIHFTPGDQVAAGALLLQIDA